MYTYLEEAGAALAARHTSPADYLKQPQQVHFTSRLQTSRLPGAAPASTLITSRLATWTKGSPSSKACALHQLTAWNNPSKYTSPALDLHIFSDMYP